MIKTEIINEKLIRHYTDNENMALKQAETGNIYEDAVDLMPCKYNYEEIAKEAEIVEN